MKKVIAGILLACTLLGACSELGYLGGTAVALCADDPTLCS